MNSPTSNNIENLSEVKLLSTKEASEISGYHSDYIARLCRSGKIAGKQVGKNWLVSHDSLLEFVKSQDARKRELSQQLSKEREQEYQKYMARAEGAIPRTVRKISPLFLKITTPADATLEEKLQKANAFQKSSQALLATLVVMLACVYGCHAAMQSLSTAEQTLSLQNQQEPQLLAATLSSGSTLPSSAYEMYANTGEFFYSGITNFMSQYLAGIQVRGAQSLAVGTFISDTGEHLPEILAYGAMNAIPAWVHFSQGILHGYTNGIYAWVDVTSQAPGEFGLAVYDTGSVVADATASIPSVTVQGYQLAMNSYVNGTNNLGLSIIDHEIAFGNSAMDTTQSVLLAEQSAELPLRDGVIAFATEINGSNKLLASVQSSGNTYSFGQQVALATYFTLHNFFESTSSALATILSGNSTSTNGSLAVEPNTLAIGTPENIGATSTQHIYPSQPANYGNTYASGNNSRNQYENSNSTSNSASSNTTSNIYQTIVQGVSQSYVDQAIANLSSFLSSQNNTDHGSNGTAGGIITPAVGADNISSNNSNFVNTIVTNAITTNATTTNSFITNLSVANTNTTNASSTNLFATNVTTANATSTNLFATLANITTGNISNLTSNLATIFGLTATNATTTNATSTNAFATNLNATNATLANATSTNFYSSLATIASGTIANLNSTLANITGLTTTNATSTNLYSSNITTPSATIGALSLSNLNGFLTATNGAVTSTPTVNLANQVAGTLLVTNGGTGTSTGGVINGIDYYNGSNLTNNSGFVYSGGNVGIGTSSPSQTLSVQGNGYISGNLTVGNNFSVINGSVNIGSSTGNVAVSGTFNSNLVPSVNDTYNLGSPALFWNNLYANNIDVNSISAASTSISGTQSASFTINSANSTHDTEAMNLIFFRGLVNPNAVISWNPGVAQFQFNQPAFFDNQSSTSTIVTLAAQASPGQTADIFRAVDSSGNVVLNATAGDFVGIGTTSPATALAVAGSGYLTGGLGIGALNTTPGSILATGNATLGSLTVGSLNGLLYGNNGAVSAASVSSPLVFNSGTLSLGTVPVANGGTGSTTLSGILVGNGTSPVSSLTVGTGLTLNGTTLSVAGIVGPGTVGQIPYYAANGSSLTATSSLYLAASGNVGIGTTTPGSLLSIGGSGLGSAVANFAPTSSTVYSPLTLTGGSLTIPSATTTEVSSISTGLSQPNSVSVSGHYAYVADQGNGLIIFDVSNPANPKNISSLQTSDDPVAVFVSGRYAYVEGQNDIDIVDISNPTSPVLVSSTGVNGISIGASIYVSGHYAYLTDSSGNYGFAIVDVSNPANPVEVGVNERYDSVDSVFVSGRYAYFADSHRLDIVDVSDPTNPITVSRLNLQNDTQQPTSVYVSGRYAYVTGIYYNRPGVLDIIDISNPANPLEVSSISTGLSNPNSVYVSGRYAYVADSGTHALVTYDISSSTNPLEVGSISTGLSSPESVYVSGRYAYVADQSGSLVTFDVGGEEANALIANSLEAGNLQVRNDITAQGQLAVSGGITANGLNLSGPFALTDSTPNATSPGTQSYSIFSLNTAASTTPIFTALYNGNIGIGTSSPSSLLSVAGSGYLTGGLGIGAVNTVPGTLLTTGTTTVGSLIDTGIAANSLTYLNSSQQLAAVTLPSYMTLTSGTLGITSLPVANGGTGSTTLSGILIGNGTSPVSSLTLGNGLSLSGTTLSVAGIIGSGTAGQFPYYAANGTALTATSSLYLAASGNIGIGTTSPNANLTISGNFIPVSTATTTISTTTLAYNTAGSYSFVVPTTGTTNIYIKAWGAGGAGGGGGSSSGGAGGYSAGTETSLGATVSIIVGGGGGSDSGGYGAGGGGASVVQINSTPVIVAGGGGGGGGNGGAYGGAGGGANGGAGSGGSGGSGGVGSGNGGSGYGGPGGPGGISGGGGYGIGTGSGGTGSGGGGGGGYGGGAGGGGYGGGGGGGYATGTATTTITGSGTTPPNTSDSSYQSSAGVGGAQGRNGNPGLVVITYVTSITSTTSTNSILESISNSGSPIATFLSSGSVGIGTTSPASLLQLSSSLTGTPNSTGSFLNVTGSLKDNNTLANGTASIFNGSSLSALTLNASNTNVTTSNASNLEISGGIIAGTNEAITNDNGLYIRSSSIAGAGTTTNSYALNVNAFTGATNNYAAIFNGGNVGIGTTSPATTLSIAGSGYFTGGLGVGEANTATNTIDVNQYGSYKQAGQTILYASSTNNSVLVGDNTGGDIISSSTASFNVALGALALNADTSGSGNNALGYRALGANTTGINSVANGDLALAYNITGNYNVAEGVQALQTNTTGSNNSALGAGALFNSITGNNNVALGSNTLFYDTSATSTVAVGLSAGHGSAVYSDQGGTYLGFQSGYSLQNGSDYNTLLGYQAGYGVTSGAGNILIGAASTTANANLTTGYGNIAIGNNISLPSATAAGQLDIGNLIYGTGLSGTGSTLSTGNIGIGTTTPGSLLSIGNSGSGSAVANFGPTTSTIYSKLTLAGDNLFIPSATTTTTEVSSISTGLSSPFSVYVSGRYAYVVDNGNHSLVIFDMSNPAIPTKVSSISTGLTGPYAVYVSGRYAYVTDLNNGLVIFDISNPTSPTKIGSISGLGGAVYAYVSGHYAYVTGIYGKSLYIVDISNPASPVLVSSISTGSSSADSVYVSGRYAYVVTSSNGMFLIFDISNPSNPILVSSTSAGLSANVKSVYVSGRYAYIVDQFDDALLIFDIANPANPIEVSSISTGLTWPTSVYVSGRYAYVANQFYPYGYNYTTQSLVTFDISSSTNPVEASSVSTALSAPDSVYVSGRYAYVTDSGADTLVTFDVGGEETNALIANSLEAGNLQVKNDITAQGQLAVSGGITANGLNLSGPFSLTASTPNATTTATQNYSIFSLNTASSTSPLFNVLYNGNIGIGTSTPSANLSIFGTTGQNLFNISTSTNQNIFNVNQNGFLGIGTSSPSSLLSIGNTNGINFSTATSTFNSTGGINLTSGCFAIGGTCIGGSAVGSGTTGQFPYYAANGTALTATSSLFLAASGNVGIGTTSPAQLLTVAGTNTTSNNISIVGPGVSLGQLLFTNGTTNSNAGAVTYNFATDELGFRTAGTADRLDINSIGNVGIGTTTPAALLDVSGAIPSSNLYTYSAGANSAYLGEIGEFTAAPASGSAIYTGNFTEIQSNAATGFTGTVGAGGFQVFDSPATTANQGVMNGVGANARHQGTGTVTTLQGGAFTANNRSPGGLVTNAFGIQAISNTNTATGATSTYMYGVLGSASLGSSYGGATYAAGLDTGVTNSGTGDLISNAYGLRVENLSNTAGTITNTYGVYIGSQTAGTQTNTPYGLYQAGSTDLNYFAGNVGIGTTTPATTLSVSGTESIAPNTTFGSALNLYGRSYDNISYITAYSNTGGTNYGNIALAPTSITLQSGSVQYGFTNANTLTTNSGSLDLAPATGFVGIGTSTPANALTVQGTGNYGVAEIIGNGTNVESSLGFRSSNVAKGGAGDWVEGVNLSSAPTNTFSIYQGGVGDEFNIAPGGNVGIGTSTPQALLDVAIPQNDGGIATYPAGSWAARILNQNDAATSNGLLVMNRWAGAGSTVFQVGSVYSGASQDYFSINGVGTSYFVGNVGIGSTTPNSLLTVSGSAPVLNIADTNPSGVAKLQLSDAGGNNYTIGRNNTTGFLNFNGFQTGYSGYNFQVNNGTNALTILNSGNVGIGTTTPTTALDVVGNSNGSISINTPTMTAATYAAAGAGAFAIRNGSANTSFSLLMGVDTTNNNSWIQSNLPGSQVEPLALNPLGGNVGIGTTNPIDQLTVTGAGTTTANIVTGSGAASTGGTLALEDTGLAAGNGGEIIFGAASGSWNFAAIKGEVGDGSGNSRGDLVFSTRTNVSNSTLSEAMRINYQGYVGIDTSSPGAYLDIKPSTGSAIPLLDIDNIANVASSINTAFIHTDQTYLSGNNTGTFTGSALEVTAYPSSFSGNTGDVLKIGTSDSSGSSFVSYMEVKAATGYVGIGTSTPAAQLQIAAGTGSEDLRLSAGNGNVNWLTGYDQNSPPNQLFGFSRNGNSLQLSTYTNSNILLTPGALNSGNAGKVGIATTTPVSTLTVVGSACISQGTGATVACGTTAGSIYYKAAATGNYDVAENYLADNSAATVQGTIVALDPSGNESITTASAGATVLGVVSTNPGLVLGGADASTTGELKAPVALSGRVPVSVSMEGGPISVGDRIALSSTPGVGMKATESGETVGIALQSASAAGKIDVFVQPQYYFDPGELSLTAAANTVSIGGSGINGASGASAGSGATNLAVSGNISTSGNISSVNITASGTGTFTGALSAATVSAPVFEESGAASTFSQTFSSLSINGTPATSVLTTDGTGVDLYKLAYLDTTGVQKLTTQMSSLISQTTLLASTTNALSSTTSSLSSQLLSMNARVSALEAGAAAASASADEASSTTGTNFINATSSALASAMQSFGILLQNGVAQFDTLVVRDLVFSKDSNGGSAAGSGEVLAGNTTVQITNSHMFASSDVSVTLTSPMTGSWYVTNKQDGSFQLTFSAAQPNIVTFDYFIVQTQGQIATSTPDTAGSPFSWLANFLGGSSSSTGISNSNSSVNGAITGSGESGTGSGASGAGAGSGSATGTGSSSSGASSSSANPNAPKVTLNGAAAIAVLQGSLFTDPGATAVDASGTDITNSIVETGTVDTNTVGLYTLTYTATDSQGNSANVSRVVSVTSVVSSSGGSSGGGSSSSSGGSSSSSNSGGSSSGSVSTSGSSSGSSSSGSSGGTSSGGSTTSSAGTSSSSGSSSTGTSSGSSTGTTSSASGTSSGTTSGSTSSSGSTAGSGTVSSGSSASASAAESSSGSSDTSSSGSASAGSGTSASTGASSDSSSGSGS